MANRKDRVLSPGFVGVSVPVGRHEVLMVPAGDRQDSGHLPGCSGSCCCSPVAAHYWTAWKMEDHGAIQ
jgi:hypothetical protein